MMRQYFLLLLCFFSLQGFAQNTVKSPALVNESAAEFQSSQFLQLDPFEIPRELQMIEQQIAQNAIDVVILNGKHTISYSQKRPEGYSKDYKNFHGLKISILPVAGEQNEFLLKLFYYNWVTNKADKTISKRISKYNVLNEMRFAMYEMLMGQQYVRDNRDILERKNFDRIQAVRKMVEENEKREKKRKREEKQKAEQEIAAKKKLEEDEKLKREEQKKGDKKKKEEEKEQTANEAANVPKVATPELSDVDTVSISPEEIEIDKKKDQPASRAKKKAKEKDVVLPETYQAEIVPPAEPELPVLDPPTPKTIAFNLTVGLKTSSVSAAGLINTKTNLDYLNLGANYSTDMLAKYPWGYAFSLNAGIPVKKQEYQISVSRALEAVVFKSFFSSRLKIGAGLEYSSLSFANLPDAGEGIQIIQNDIVYGKARLSYDFLTLGRNMSLGLESGASLSQSSSANRTITVNKTHFWFQTQIKGDHGVGLHIYQEKFSGYYSGKGSGSMLQYVYNFGN